MTERPEPTPRRPQPPILPSPPRQIAHALVAGVGWVVFGWWWWLVLGRLNSDHVWFTVFFIAITTVVCVALTGIWSFHNLLIYRRRGPRTQVREVTSEFATDRLGRPIAYLEPREALVRAALVEVGVEKDRKTYRSGGPAASAAGKER